MNNKKRFIYNGIMLTLVGIAMRTVALLFNAFISRTVGAEGVGLYTVVNTVYSFAVTFATSGISLTVTRLVAEARGEGREEDVSRVLLGAVIYTLIFSIVATLVLFFGADIIALYVLDEPRAAKPLCILAPSLIPLSLVSVFSGYFIGVRRVGKNSTVQILGQVFRISATAWLILHATAKTAEESAKYLAIGVSVTEIASFIVMLIQFLLDRRGKVPPRESGFALVGRSALPLAVSAYIRQALLTVEHVLIPRRLRDYGLDNSSALSAYGILHGMALPTVLYPMVILSSFSGLLIPEFAERSALHDRSGCERLCRTSLSLTLIYGTAVAGIIFVFSEELGYVIYSSAAAGEYIAVLSLVIPLMYLDHVTDSILKGIGEQVYSMWVNIADSLISIALVWLLIPRLGILGYAVCIIVMEAFNFILSVIRLCQRIRIRISLVRSLLLPALASVGSSYLVRMLFIRQGTSASALWLCCEIVFAAAAFFAIRSLCDLVYTALCQRLTAGARAGQNTT